MAASSCPLAQPLTPIEPLHGQSILEVLRTRPLTARAPGGDRRLSGEALHVGGHSYRSDHDPHGALPGLQGRRTGPRFRVHLRRGRAHLYTYDLHCVHGQRSARCVPERKVISGQSRSATGTANRPLPAATQVIELAERSLRASGQPSSSLGHDVGRVLRVQAKPLPGRFASLDMARPPPSPVTCPVAGPGDSRCLPATGA